MENALIIGKFDPLHIGQLSIIDSASALADRVTILLLSGDNFFTCEQRVNHLLEMRPRLTVITAPTELPSLDSDLSDADWLQYKTTARNLNASCLVGSDPQMAKLGQMLDIPYYILDPKRDALPVYGADLRQDIIKGWYEFSTAVRKSMQKRLTFVGPESVGKSSLAKLLAAEFGGPHIPEYGRPYETYRTKGDYTDDDLLQIIKGHRAHRTALTTHAGPIIFEDTDALMTSVWATMLMGKPSEVVEADIDLADHYLLLDADVPWVSDGVRYFGQEKRRKLFLNEVRKKLEQCNANYTLISGDWKDRKNHCTTITENMINKLRADYD